MKKIQPFTIGTKLSVPSEAKCPDYVGIVLPVPAVDCCELRNESNNEISPFREERVSTPHNSAPMEELSEEDIKEDDRDSASPSASSRSIRKIAMCGNTESEKNCHVSHFNTINYETNKTNSSTEKVSPVEERLSDRSASQLETEPWNRGRKIKNLHYDYSTPAFPHDQPEDASHSQRRDRKDFENSLIQLTASLDLSQEEPKVPLQKKTEAGDLGLEMLRRRPTPGDHIDKSWLKLRSLLRDYHQDLMLALEVSSFYQQADNILSAINCKRNILLMTDIHKSSQDKETREIACQINMLNESASRLSNLHPTLARRVTFKQSEVKENWAFFQEFLRNQKTDVCSKCPSSSLSDPLTTCPDSQSFARNEGHSVMGKDVKEEQNRLRGFECSQSMWAHRMWSPIEECSVGRQDSLSESSCSKLDSISEKQDMDRKSCISQMPETTLTPSNKHLIPCKMLNESTTSPEMALWLKDSTNVGDREEHDCSKQSQDHKIEELLRQVEGLWDALQKKYGENDEIKPAVKELIGNKPEQMMLSYHLQESVEEGSSGMLAKFLELLDPSGYQKMSQDVPDTHNSPEMAEATEMSLNLLGGQTDKERSQKFDQTTEELQISLSTLTLRINQHLSRCAELSMDLLDIEADTAVLCDSDLSRLDGLHEQQDDLEAHYHIIEGEVKRMERLASQLQVPSPEQKDPIQEEVQAILQAWEEAGRNMAENRGRLKKFHQIQDYFENYLAMITWTENARSCILTGSSAWGESEVTEIDHSIETKLDEFNTLATAGQMLVQEESPFKNIIKERTDELQSMLGWIQVNWHAQREQLKGEQNVRREETNDAVQQEAIPLKNHLPDSLCITNTESIAGSMETQPSQSNFEQQKRHDVSSVVSQESCLSKTALGSSICLILSFDEQSTGINQVTKQWSPNNNEAHCIKNAITVATHNEEHMESTSNVQVNSGQQSQDSNSMQMQQSLEMCQVRWQNGSIINKEPEQESSCGNLALNDNQVQPIQLPGKEKVPSDLFPGSIQHLSCNRLLDSLQSPTNNQTHLQLSSDAIQTQDPELMRQAQNQQLPIYSRKRTQQPSYKNLEMNQQPASNKNDYLGHDAAAEVTHRVFTYLHVSDSYKSADRALDAVSPPLHAPEDETAPALAPASLSSNHLSSVPAHDVTSEGGAVCNQNRFKASSVFTLKEPIRSREGEQRRRSTLGIVGLERSGKSSSIFRRRCNTWPEGERRGEESQSNSKLQVFVKKGMIMVDSVMEDKSNSVTFLEDSATNTIKTPSGPVKNICSYLSLGSTLSFSLPKRFHSSVSELENKEESGAAMIYNNPSDLNNQTFPSAQTSTVLKPHPAVQTEPVIHTEQTEVDSHSICKVINMKDLEDMVESTTEVKTQQLNDSIEPVLMQEEVQTSVECTQWPYKDLDKHKPALNSSNDSPSQHKVSPPAVSGSSSGGQCSPLSLSSAACGHQCLSVHTKIKDLNSHLYYTSKYMKINSPANFPPQALSNGPADSESQKSARVINCGVRDCAVCFSDTVKETEDARLICAGKDDISKEGVLQPGHWLFQQEEEELEDIWRGRVGNLNEKCTMETNMEEETGLSITINRGPVSLPLHG